MADAQVSGSCGQPYGFKSLRPHQLSKKRHFRLKNSHFAAFLFFSKPPIFILSQLIPIFFRLSFFVLSPPLRAFFYCPNAGAGRFGFKKSRRWARRSHHGGGQRPGLDNVVQRRRQRVYRAIDYQNLCGAVYNNLPLTIIKVQSTGLERPKATKL